MLYLYLDESGDLGFDFDEKKPSKFFTITILAVRGGDSNKNMIHAVYKTLKRKLNAKRKRGKFAEELKGTNTTLEIKKYFYELIKNIPFKLYSLTLNKRCVYLELKKHKERFYNYLSRLVLDEIPFEGTAVCVYLFLDKSKGKSGIRDFNEYIAKELKGRIPLSIPLYIYHEDSKGTPGLQATDLFAWGIFRKHERNDNAWYEIFKTEKLAVDKLYFSSKEK